jgi:hypothetical protein
MAKADDLWAQCFADADHPHFNPIRIRLFQNGVPGLFAFTGLDGAIFAAEN